MMQRRLTACLAMALTLSACGVLPEKQTIAIYSPLSAIQPLAAWPASARQLVVLRPTGSAMIDSARIVVRPDGNELQVYKGAVWSDPAPDLLQTSVVRVLEDSGRLRGVGRRGSGVAGEQELLMDIRRFEADYAGSSTPVATIEVSAKLVSTKDNAIVANRLFQATQAASGTDVAAVNAAFQTALAQVTRDIAGWSLQESGRHPLN